MKKSSITYTKNHLSALLQEVQAGQTILILDRNIPVATLSPVQQKTFLKSVSWIEKVEREGLVRRAKSVLESNFFEVKRPVTKGKNGVLESLIQERREGR